MKDRLAQFLKSEGLTAVKFAEIMEVQPSSISHLLSGRNKPNFDFISRILLRFPSLNPDWLINGIGEIYKSNPKNRNSPNTDVNENRITDVIETDGTIQTENKDTVRQGDMFEYSLNKEDKDISGNDNDPVTVVNSRIPDKTMTEGNDASRADRKSISRVIIFYADGSFDEYRN